MCIEKKQKRHWSFSAYGSETYTGRDERRKIASTSRSGRKSFAGPGLFALPLPVLQRTAHVTRPFAIIRNIHYGAGFVLTITISDHHLTDYFLCSIRKLHVYDTFHNLNGHITYNIIRFFHLNSIEIHRATLKRIAQLKRTLAKCIKP